MTGKKQTTHNNQIAVLDFGGQYAHLIANRIRRLGVKSVIKPSHSKANDLKDFAGIILSGGPLSVNDPNSPSADPEIFKLGIPILGICYGHQVTNHVLGGKIKPGKTKEYGHTIIHIEKPVGIFEGINKADNSVWSSHWDEVVELPVNFEVLASSKDSPFVAVGNLTKHIYGIQFHAEVTHTPIGMRIFKNFVKITGAKKTWSMKRYLKLIKESIKAQVKSSPLIRGERGGSRSKVFMMVSGGVDSMVAFSLINKTIGEQNAYGMLVDTGFMRKGEIEEIQQEFDTLGWHNLHVYDAKEEYFQALKGIHDPEEKRHIIGKLFVEIQARAVEELGLSSDKWLLGQGTIYPDTIESGVTKHADKIKTHHNRVPEIMNLINQGLVIEPLADLYKDEVRELGEQIGLSHHLVWRHPFPGPGLAIRCLCTPVRTRLALQEKKRKKDKKNISQKTTLEKTFGASDYNYEQEPINTFLKKYKLTGTILPVQSVGVQGDTRTYRHPLLVSGPIKWNQKKLQELSTSLTNQFESINRVLINLTESLPKTSRNANKTQSDKYSPFRGSGGDMAYHLLPNQTLTPERINLLQEADKIVMDEIEQFDSVEKIIWQCPTILLPLSLSQPVRTRLPLHKGKTYSTTNKNQKDQPRRKNFGASDTREMPNTKLFGASAKQRKECIVLRPFSSKDVMSANFALFPEQNLQNIIKKLRMLPISGIFYDITNKPPGTIEWE